jgi:hypothetical protein
MAVDIAAIRKRMEQINSGGKSGGNTFKRWKYEKPGTYRVRVLPFKNTDPGMPFPERLVYFGISATGGGMIVSPENAGERDPIKDFRINLYNQAKDAATPVEAEELKEMAKKLKSKTLNCVAIVDRANEANGVCLWTPNWTDTQQLLALFLTEVGDYTDVGPDGCDLEIVVTPGKKVNQQTKKPILEAKIQAARKNSPAAKDDAQLKEWLESMPNLDEYYPVTSTEETEKRLAEWLDAADHKTDSDGTARGGSSKIEEKSDEKPKAEKLAEPVKAVERKAPVKAPVPKKPLLASVEDQLDDELNDLASGDD